VEEGWRGKVEVEEVEEEELVEVGGGNQPAPPNANIPQQPTLNPSRM